MLSNSPTKAIKKLQRGLEHKFLWVAYSGGIDSSVLLHAVVKVFGPKSCGAIYIDHQINPLSKQWSAHCEHVCREIGIRFLSRPIRLNKGNLENQARLARYKEWAKLLRRGEVILTAHHADDVAETRLWQLFTGRAPIGIPHTRPLGLAQIIRPFLSLKRTDIEVYAAENDLRWIEDCSNKDSIYDRNWLRHELLPITRRRFPKAVENLANLKWPELPTFKKEALPIASASHEMNIRAWLQAYGLFPRDAQIREIMRQSSLRDRFTSVSLSKFLSVRSHQGRLFVVREKEPIKHRHIRVGEFLNLDSGQLRWRRSGRGFSAGDLVFLGTRKGGESISVGTRSKSLNEIFRERQVPLWQRDVWPLLFVDGLLESVPGITMSDKYFSNEKDGTYVPVWEPSE